MPRNESTAVVHVGVTLGTKPAIFQPPSVGE